MGGNGMIIIEHKSTGDVEHIVPYNEMDSYIRKILQPGVYFTMKAQSVTDHDMTYKAPSANKWQ